MLLFAHTGITLGAAAVLAGALKYKNKSGNGILTWFRSFSEYVDIRILIIGSMLPDIIDKPLGMVFFREEFSSGRIFAHSLLFLVVLGAAGFYLFRKRQKTWLLVLAFGTFIHLALDQIWLMPKTVLWPWLGFSFERIEITDWYSLWFRDILAYPDIFIPELVGLGILLWFGAALVVRKKVGVFLKRGRGY